MSTDLPEIPVPPAGSHGTARIFCTDGHYFDIVLVLPWAQFISNLIGSGAYADESVFINRQFILRVERRAPGQSATTQASNVVDFKGAPS